MRRMVGAAIAAILAAGCGENGGAEPNSFSSGSSAVSQRTAPGDPVALEGTYRVASIDGAALDDLSAPMLTADDREIWWEPRCARQMLRYRIEGDRFVPSVNQPAPTAAPSPAVDAPPPPPAPVICAIALPERLPATMAALRAGRRIERTSQNGILISGDGRSVTLVAQ